MEACYGAVPGPRVPSGECMIPLENHANFHLLAARAPLTQAALLLQNLEGCRLLAIKILSPTDNDITLFIERAIIGLRTTIREEEGQTVA
jgi:hypothetical protein